MAREGKTRREVQCRILSRECFKKGVVNSAKCCVEIKWDEVWKIPIRTTKDSGLIGEIQAYVYLNLTVETDY